MQVLDGWMVKSGHPQQRLEAGKNCV